MQDEAKGSKNGGNKTKIIEKTRKTKALRKNTPNSEDSRTKVSQEKFGIFPVYSFVAHSVVS